MMEEGGLPLGPGQSTLQRHARPAILNDIPLRGPAVIEASAGTGKTFTIEHLFVELLLTTDVSIEQILVVTYTEKATWELRQRVRRKLEELLGSGSVGPLERPWEVTPALQQKLRVSLQQFDVAAIHTIHAFCHRVMREQSFAGGRPLEQQQVAMDEALNRAFKQVVRTAVHNNPLLRQFVRAAAESGKSIISSSGRRGRVPEESLEEYLREALEKRVLLHPRLDVGALETALAQASSTVPHPGPFSSMLRGPGGSCRGSSMFERVRALHQLAVAHAQAPNLARFLVEAADAVEHVLGRWTCMDPSVLGPCRDVCLAYVPFSSALTQLLLPLVRKQLEEEKRALGLFDFDDMISVVRTAVEGPATGSVVAELRRRYRYALIDEFQDTDDAQWAIFKRVFFDSGGTHVLYLVGDPKQSIYSFRGADVRTYQRAVAEVIQSGGARVRLDSNHRSSERLIEACNLILDDTEDPPLMRGSIRYQHPVCFGGSPRQLGRCGQPMEPVHVFHVHVGAKDRPARVQALLATRVAEEIARLVKDPPDFYEHGESRPLGRGDIYVLTHRTAEGHQLGAELGKRGVAHAFYRQEGLFQTQEAQDVLRILQAIADPHDHGRRCRAWLTRFFALSLEDLEAAREVPPGHPLVVTLLHWNHLSNERRWAEVFREMMEETGLVRRLLFGEQSARALTNYRHVMEVMLREVVLGRHTAHELAGRLQTYVDERGLPDGDNANVQRLETDRNAVQIMTVHVSKGLEAPVVFLLGGLSKGARNRVRLAYVNHQRVGLIGAGKETVAPAEEARREEEQRLIYVALTRARVRLYVPLVTADKRPSDDVFAAFAGPHMHLNRRLWALQEARGFTPPGLFAWESVEPITARPSAQMSPEPLATWKPTPPEQADDGAFSALRSRHMGFAVTSYSQMRHGDARMDWDANAEDAAAVQHHDTHAAPDGDALPGGRESGRFLHGVLERVPHDSLVQSPNALAWAELARVARIFEEEARKHQVSTRYVPHAAALVYTALTTPIQFNGLQLPAIGSVRPQVREMEFAYPLRTWDAPRQNQSERGFMRGFVDLIFEHQGRCYFVDWKSDTLTAWDAASVSRVVESRYLLQEQVYALAMMRMFGIRSPTEHAERFGGTLFLFVRGMVEGGGVHFRSPDWQTLCQWEQDIIHLGGGNVA
jgi:exodeoxyribonuclease V beta subunit